MFFMKKTISNTNKYFSTAKKKEKMIINAVYSSIKVENSLAEVENVEKQPKADKIFIETESTSRKSEKPQKYTSNTENFIKTKKQAEQATLDEQGQKSGIEKRFTPQEFAKLSSDEQLKVLSGL